MFVKPTKILGTYKPNGPFKNYYFGTTVNFAKGSLTTFYNRIVVRQAKYCLYETLTKSFMVQRS